MEIRGQAEREKMLETASTHQKEVHAQRLGATLPPKPLTDSDFEEAFDLLILGIEVSEQRKTTQ